LRPPAGQPERVRRLVLPSVGMGCGGDVSRTHCDSVRSCRRGLRARDARDNVGIAVLVFELRGSGA
jgi:hypothetical protein